MPKSEKVILDILTVAKEEKALNSAVMDYITVKKTIKDLEAQLDVQKKIITEYSKASGIHGIKFMNNVIDYIPQTEITILNKDKFKLNLLNAGVEAGIINKCEADATDKRGRAGYLKLHNLDKASKK